MSYHNGDVLIHPTIHAIFWLPSGYNFDDDNSQFENLITGFLGHVQGSSYYHIVHQYTGKDPVSGDTNNVGPYLTYEGSYVDTNPFPSGDPTKSNPLQESQEQAEVESDISAAGWSSTRTDDSMYALFLPKGVYDCNSGGDCLGGSGDKSYCAYHTSLGQTGTYLDMPNDNTESGGCEARTAGRTRASSEPGA